jgi:hypothetical protein
MLEIISVILLILITAGAAYFTRINMKRNKRVKEVREYELLQENLKSSLIGRNRSLIDLITSLLQENIDLTRDRQEREDHISTTQNAKKLVINLNRTLNNFSSDNNKSSAILSLILLEGELSRMVDKLDDEIIKLDPPEGKIYN